MLPTIRCVVCRRQNRLKHTINEHLRDFLRLDDAYVRTTDDYIRLSEIVRSGRDIRWICQWCHNSYESAFLVSSGKQRAKWAVKELKPHTPEHAQFYATLLLAKRLIKEAVTRP